LGAPLTAAVMVTIVAVLNLLGGPESLRLLVKDELGREASWIVIIVLAVALERGST
jgi:hypothetical protein